MEKITNRMRKKFNVNVDVEKFNVYVDVEKFNAYVDVKKQSNLKWRI